LSPVTWKLVWLASIVSAIVLFGSLLYLLIYVVPLEKLIFKVIHPIVSLFNNKEQTEKLEEPQATTDAVIQETEKSTA